MFPLPGEIFSLHLKCISLPCRRGTKTEKETEGEGESDFTNEKLAHFASVFFEKIFGDGMILVDIVRQLRILFLDREIKGFSNFRHSRI